MNKKFIRFAKLRDSFPENPFPQQENGIVHSKISNYEHKYDKPTLSLKYVIKGKENYKIDGYTYAVKPQEYLLVNADRDYSTSSAYKNQIDEGICLYIEKNTIWQVYRTLKNSDKNLLDNPFNEQNKSLVFFENVYKAKDSSLGQLLLELENYLTEKEDAELPNNEEFYYVIAEKLLIQQREVFEQYNRLNTVKTSTKKELYRRLDIAKKYIDANYCKKLDIQEISRVAAISEYHFFRSFKQVYGVSPYKYLLNKRMVKAKNLLFSREYSVTEIAYLTGFSDIHAFSKAFKKAFSFTPMQLLKKSRQNTVRMAA